MPRRQEKWSWFVMKSPRASLGFCFVFDLVPRQQGRLQVALLSGSALPLVLLAQDLSSPTPRRAQRLIL